MNKAHEEHTDVKDETGDRVASDLETLKGSFAQLREDVTRLIDSTLGTGRNGAGMLKDRASAAAVGLKDRMGDLEDRGVESIEKFGQRIGERPLLSAAIAVGIGFVLARVFTIRR